MTAKQVDSTRDLRSLERLVPDDLRSTDVTGTDTLALHLARYQLAQRHARGRILDMACGVGYGTRLLADHGRDVTEAVGVDRSEDAVAYATGRYQRDGVRFVCEDALRFHDPGGFDTVVSLETIEHVDDPDKLIVRLIAALRPGGVLITSVPTTPSADVNPHHLHDFTEASFRAMVERYGMREIDQLRQIQPYELWSVLTRTEPRMNTMRGRLTSYYLRHPRAAARRLAATVRYGFTNRYVTIAWERAQ
ncbi:MAG: class I SAM-dependent methyltransferase [Deltaproteobacteria bacterium]|nr:class I SAM-dependent methyltransferase [Deltaproteobacteria bacterium]